MITLSPYLTLSLMMHSRMCNEEQELELDFVHPFWGIKTAYCLHLFISGMWQYLCISNNMIIT